MRQAARVQPVSILIAEDSPTQREQLRFLLEEYGFRTVAAPDGEAAFELAKESRPDLLISDVVMPKMTGFDLCRAIRKTPELSDLPVLLVTSLSSPTDVFLGLECGADNFITKPYDEKYLLSRINYILTNRELRREGKLQVGIEIELAGERHFITAERQQILDLLVSTYEQAVRLNEEVEHGQKLLSRSYSTLNALYRFAQGLNFCTSEDEVMRHTLDRCLELPGVRAGWITLRDSDGRFTVSEARNLPFEAGAGMPAEELCECQRALLEEGLTGARNVAQCHLIANAAPGRAALHCHATVPLLAGEAPLGLLNLAGEGDGDFDEADLRTLSALGQQVAVALERIRLYRGLEEKVAERTAELRQSEAMMRMAGHVARLGGWAIGLPDLRFSCSDEVAAIHRVRAGSIRAIEDVIDLYAPEYRDRLRQAVDACMRDGTAFDEELQVVTAEDRRIWIRAIGEAVYGEDGAIARVHGAFQDISAQKRAEAALDARARQQAMIAELGQRALSGISATDLMREAVDASAQVLEVPLARVFLRRSGRGSGTVRAEYGWDDTVYPPDPDGRIKLSVGHYCMEHKHPVVVEDWSLEARFSITPRIAAHNVVSSSAVPIFDAGSAVGFLAVETDRRRAFDRDEVGFLQSVANIIGVAVQREQRDERLRQANELTEGILESSPTAIVTLDAQQRILTWNKAAESIFGFTSEEVVGRRYSDVLEQDVEAFDETFAQLRDGHALSNVEAGRRNKAGEVVRTRTSGSPLYDQSGEFRGATFTHEDMTERRRVEDQLRQAQKMEAIGNLTGGIAHDFNNLLTVVIGNLDLLVAQEGDDAVVKEFATTALNGALRGAELTRQLLAFSRKQPLAPRITDVNVLLRGMVRLLERTIGENVSIELDLCADPWPVLIDRGQLDSTIVNLVVNARDAMPDGGRLLLATRNATSEEILWDDKPDVTDGDYVVLEVTDSGTGIPEDKIQQIFEPFFTTKPEGKGTGLGLSMVYGFVKQSGGHISVYSEVGHGTTFRLYLPHAREHDADADAADAASPASLLGKGETILVVEDNPAVRSTVIRQLRSLGYVVVEASSGAEAMRKLEEDRESFDLVFSDIVMAGGVSGQDLAQIISRRWPDLRLLLTSGYPEMAVKRREEITAEMLSKPYRQVDLARKIRETLDK